MRSVPHSKDIKPKVVAKNTSQEELHSFFSSIEKTKDHAHELTAKFLQSELTLSDLSDLTENELKEDLGLALGVRKAILKALSEQSVLNSGERIKELKGIQLQEQIGEGNFGAVFKGEWNGVGVALKTVKSQYLRDLRQELLLAKKIEHPHLLRTFGLFRMESTTFIVSEYMELGDLLGLIRNEPNKITSQDMIEMYFKWFLPFDFIFFHLLPFFHLLFFFSPFAFFFIPFAFSSRHICLGMLALSEEKITHRDLACRNVLMSGHSGFFSAKVADFGMR